MFRRLPSVPVVGQVVPLNAGDVDRALAYWTETAVVKLVGLPGGIRDSYSGKKQVRVWFNCLVRRRLQFQVKVVNVQGDVVSTHTETRRRELTGQASLATLITTESYMVQEGKVARLTVTLSGQSLSALQSQAWHKQGGDTAESN